MGAKHLDVRNVIVGQALVLGHIFIRHRHGVGGVNAVAMVVILRPGLTVFFFGRQLPERLPKQENKGF